MKSDRQVWKGISLWVCFCSFLLTLCGDAEWMATSGNAPMWTRLTYQWIHGNVIHYGMNALMLLTIAFKLQPKGSMYFVALTLSASCPSWMIGCTPVIGLSGLLFSLTGLLLPAMPNWRWALASNMMLLAATALLPNIAVGLHAWCYVTGIAIGIIITPLNWHAGR